MVSTPNRGAALTQKYLSSLLPWLPPLPARALSFVPKESWLNAKSHFVSSMARGTEPYTQNTTYSSTWSSPLFSIYYSPCLSNQVILTTRPHLLPIHIYNNLRSDPKHTSSEVIFLGPPHSFVTNWHTLKYYEFTVLMNTLFTIGRLLQKCSDGLSSNEIFQIENFLNIKRV